jgi:hypothetical protein
MYVQRHTVTITTDASGDGTGYTGAISGRVLGIRYVKTDYADTVDFTITANTTGQAILTVANVTASATYYPRDQVHDTADGSALTMDGTRKMVAPVALGQDTVKIVVAAGGDTKSGTFYVLTE